MQSQQVARHLSGRCNQGDREALRAFLFSVADGLYTASLAASEDENQAGTLAARAWERLVNNLGRWSWREHLQIRLRQILRHEIIEQAGEPVAQRALQLWGGANGEELVAAPTELLERLETTTSAAVPLIQRRARRRHRLAWAGLALAAVLVVSLLAGLAGVRHRLVTGRARQVAFETLQQRVQDQHLAWAVRDVLLNLADPQGADRPQAEVLAQVVLLLEEIASSSASTPAYHLSYLKRRLGYGHLLSQVRELAWEAPAAERPPLMQTALVLEEVQGL